MAALAGAAAYAVSACGTDNNFAPIETRPDADNGPVDVLQTQPLRVANFNTHNLFNDKLDSPDISGEQVDTTEVYQAHLTGVAKILAKLDADVVVLEEVENEAVLNDLVARPEIAEKKYDYHAISAGDPRGIHIAAISTIPFQKVLSHGDEKFLADGTLVTPPTNETYYTFSRDCLELHISLGRSIVLLGSHLKAKSSDDPEKRLAEARRTRFIANEHVGVSGVVILGDFNDGPGSDPINALIGDNPAFTSAGALIPEADRWSYEYNGTRTLFDDQIVDPIMTAFRDPASVSLLHDSDLDPSLADVSDHAPIAVTYNIQ
ncbi:MAG: hypothetical protein U0165_01965 [Polyangiaceae bacterium]